jgi:hypothetical protein
MEKGRSLRGDIQVGKRKRKKLDEFCFSIQGKFEDPESTIDIEIIKGNGMKWLLTTMNAEDLEGMHANTMIAAHVRSADVRVTKHGEDYLVELGKGIMDLLISKAIAEKISNAVRTGADEVI